MKVIFLDVDGVLNSMDYLEENYYDYRKHPINRKCVERLARIVKKTDARLVLSSSWRTGWSPEPDKVMPACQILNDALAEFGLEIYDKTDSFKISKRALEIYSWLKKNKGQVESFLILDDNNYDWESHGLGSRWLQTDFELEGLKEKDIPDALEILNRRYGLGEKISLFLNK